MRVLVYYARGEPQTPLLGVLRHNEEADIESDVLFKLVEDHDVMLRKVTEKPTGPKGQKTPDRTYYLLMIDRQGYHFSQR